MDLKLKILFCISGLMPIISNAQPSKDLQTPCVTTSQNTAGNFVISYTIGEMILVESVERSGLLITQGILQPFTGVLLNTYDCFTSVDLNIYPNPSSGIFNMKLSLFKKGKFESVITDALGKRVFAEAFIYNSFALRQYNIQKFASGIYFLQVSFTEDDNGTTKKCVYTIEKTN
jgi:hypothetical protein